jgi:hypothetical protein
MALDRLAELGAVAFSALCTNDAGILPLVATASACSYLDLGVVTF